MFKVAYTITERRAGDVASCYADATLAEEELGWKAERTLDEMCKFFEGMLVCHLHCVIAYLRG